MTSISKSLVLGLGIALVAWPSLGAPRVAVGGVDIDRTEVTIAQFADFLRETGRVSAAEREGGGFEYSSGWVRRNGWNFRTPEGRPGEEDEPAAHITWGEARDYCSHRGGRLPARQEWTSAAYTEARSLPPAGFVSGQRYVYPSGERPDGMNNNRKHHLPARLTLPGVNGLHDMGGNLWEWLADERGEEALTAGGSWWYGPEQAKADAMQWKNKAFAALYIGFRCVYSPRP
jgi:formylglycine-generating enzyme